MDVGVAGRARLGPVVTVLTVTIGLQCLRALFPVAYSYRETGGLARTALVLVLVFTAPVIAPVAARAASRRTALLVGIAALTVARLALQVVDTLGIGLAATAAAIGLVAIVLTAGSSDGGRTATIAVVAVTRMTPWLFHHPGNHSVRRSPACASSTCHR